MTESSKFDAYHKWLGIKPDEQPPNYYRMLGIGLFEADGDVIDSAAEQRMTFLQNCAMGEHVKHSQKLLNEVSTARVTLLNPDKKSKYDAKLKAEIDARKPAATQATVQAEEFPIVGIPSSQASVIRRRRRKSSSGMVVIVICGALVAYGGYKFIPSLTQFTENSAETKQKPSKKRSQKVSKEKADENDSSKTKVAKSDSSKASKTNGDKQDSQTPIAGGRLTVGPPGEIRRLAGHEDLITAVAFSRDGQLGLSCSHDESVRLWDIVSSRQLHQLDGLDGTPTAIAFSSVGDQAAAADNQGNIVVWDVESGKETARLIGHRDAVNGIAFFPDGKRLISAGQDTTVRLWSIETEKSVGKFIGHSAAVRAVAVSADGSFAATGGDDFTARLWDVELTEQSHVFNADESVAALTFSADGNQLVGLSQSTIRVWNIRTREVEHRVNEMEKSLLSVVMSSSGRYLLIGASDKTLRFWDLQADALVEQFDADNRYTNLVALSANDRLLLTGGGGYRPVGSKRTQTDGDFDLRLWRLPKLDGSLKSKSTDSTRPTPATDTKPFLTLLPLPSDEELSTARQELKQKYKAEFRQATTRDEKHALAATLLSAGAQSKGDVPGRYVLLAEAADLAAEAGNFALAAQAIDALAAGFENVNKVELKESAIKKSVRLAKTAAENRTLALAFQSLLDQAIEIDDYVAAGRIGTSMLAAARKAGYMPFRDELQQQVKLATTLRLAFKSAESARNVLKLDLKDADANSAWGRFLCYYKADWEFGLPLLTKGSDETLAALAQSELADASDPDQLVHIGDEWWQLSIKESGIAQRNLQDRANAAYLRALPDLAALERPAIELKMARAFGKTSVIQLDEQPMGISIGAAAVNPGPMFTVEFWVSTTADTGVLLTKRHGSNQASITIGLADGQVSLVADTYRKPTTVRSQVDINDGGWHHLAVVKLGSELILYVDGQPGPMLTTTNTYSSISDWKLGYHGVWDAGQLKANFCRIRFSGSARYNAPFLPDKQYAKDKYTTYIR